MSDPNTPRTRRERTPEQEAKAKESMGQISRTRTAIIASGKHQGQVQCPRCEGGVVDFIVSRSNGHVHCFCRSCPFGWME
jgi:transposase-like protein